VEIGTAGGVRDEFRTTESPILEAESINTVEDGRREFER
jgi:hypothetical protein